MNKGLLDLLYSIAEELGRVPTFEDVKKHPKMPHPNTYAFYFGSFPKAVDLIEGKFRIAKLQESRMAGKTDKEAEIMPRKVLSDEQVLEVLYQKYFRHGRLPNGEEINADPDLPSYQTIYNRFGIKTQLEERLKEYIQATNRPNSVETETATNIATAGSKENATAEATIDAPEEDMAAEAMVSEPDENTYVESAGTSPVPESPQESTQELAQELPQGSSQEPAQELPPQESSQEPIQEPVAKPEPSNQMTIDVKDDNGTVIAKLTITLTISLSR